MSGRCPLDKEYNSHTKKCVKRCANTHIRNKVTFKCNKRCSSELGEEDTTPNYTVRRGRCILSENARQLRCVANANKEFINGACYNRCNPATHVRINGRCTRRRDGNAAYRPETPRCKCLTKSGVQCKHAALQGNDFCYMHKQCRSKVPSDSSSDNRSRQLSAPGSVGSNASVGRSSRSTSSKSSASKRNSRSMPNSARHLSSLDVSPEEFERLKEDQQSSTSKSPMSSSQSSSASVPGSFGSPFSRYLSQSTSSKSSTSKRNRLNEDQRSSGSPMSFGSHISSGSVPKNNNSSLIELSPNDVNKLLEEQNASSRSKSSSNQSTSISSPSQSSKSSHVDSGSVNGHSLSNNDSPEFAFNNDEEFDAFAQQNPLAPLQEQHLSPEFAFNNDEEFDAFAQQNPLHQKNRRAPKRKPDDVVHANQFVLRHVRDDEPPTATEEILHWIDKRENITKEVSGEENALSQEIRNRVGVTGNVGAIKNRLKNHITMNSRRGFVLEPK